MKSLFVSLLLLACAGMVMAETDSPALPPPKMGDPGVSAAVEQAPETQQQRETRETDPLAPLPKTDTRPVRDRAMRKADREAASELTVRQEGSDRIEEFRQDGRLWMIRIVPAKGDVREFIDRTGDGRLDRGPEDGPVAPVYYRLYEWN